VLDDPRAFQEAVAAELRAHTELIEHWITYSADKRTSRGPYLCGRIRNDSRYEVGFYDTNQGQLDQVSYDDAVSACADFLHRQAAFVLRGERVL
jgi:hypothetical protein